MGKIMFHFLKRHPIPIKAFFQHSLVLTYALPQKLLRPLLPPGLSLDTYENLGFIAVAMVQTKRLRPAFMPAQCGQNFHLTGYRIFSRYRMNEGRRLLRGLRIIRSDTDRALFRMFGNLLTHYNYRQAKMDVHATDGELRWAVKTPSGEADLRVVADLESDAQLPAGSPFKDWREARKYTAPLPFTFDYERETHSIVRIEGVRPKWHPRPVRVDVEECTFFRHPPFDKAAPLLANAFYVDATDYSWKRGIREALPN
ncbi:MAG: DUF2071 domain-containing protein [Pyrinomonadaceae bacterium]